MQWAIAAEMIAMLRYWPAIGALEAYSLTVCLASSLLISSAAGAQTQLNSVIFGSLDISGSPYAAAGFKRGLFGPVDRSGFTLLGAAGLGRDENRDPFAPRGRRRTTTSEGQLFLGYQWFGDAGAGLVVHAGLKGQHRSEPHPSGRQDEAFRLGPAILIDAWLPLSEALLLDTTLAATTIRSSIWARLALATPISWRGLKAGPELIGARDDGSREAKVGLHLGGLALGPVMMRLSGGWTFRDPGRNGAYAALTAYGPL